MRKYGWACAIVLSIACGEDDTGTPATLDRSLLDATFSRIRMDGGAYTPRYTDGSTLAPSCPTLDVCSDNKPALLYNVCIRGTATGTVARPACLIDTTGVLYLAPLTSNQIAMIEGWTQSNDVTLSAADQLRCDAARAALLADAATLPKCAGGL